MTEKQKKTSSKFLSYVLRHHPEIIGLQLNSEGWADVAELLARIRATGREIDMPELLEIVSTNAKKRFSFNEDHSLIRANQGHSLDIDLGLNPTEPPPILYHGTATKYLEDILLNGIRKMTRHHVHLTSDLATAQQVGSRHGNPVILSIAAGQMWRNGISFFRSDNGVWLTETVETKYFEVIQ